MCCCNATMSRKCVSGDTRGGHEPVYGFSQLESTRVRVRNPGQQIIRTPAILFQRGATPPTLPLLIASDAKFTRVQSQLRSLTRDPWATLFLDSSCVSCHVTLAFVQLEITIRTYHKIKVPSCSFTEDASSYAVTNQDCPIGKALPLTRREQKIVDFTDKWNSEDCWYRRATLEPRFYSLADSSRQGSGIRLNTLTTWMDPFALRRGRQITEQKFERYIFSRINKTSKWNDETDV